MKYLIGALLSILAATAVAQPKVVVTNVYRDGNPARASNQNDSVGISGIIEVRVTNLTELINRSNGIIRTAKGDTVRGSKQDIGLFLDGRLMAGLAPESFGPYNGTDSMQRGLDTVGDPGTLRFHLGRNAENDEAWADILGSPKHEQFFVHKDIPVSVGLVNGSAEESFARLNLIRIRKTNFWICVFGLLGYLFALVWLGRKTSILRDNGIDATSVGIPRGSNLTTFSLGRLQMAFWFSLVLGSFLFIWLITGAMDIISSSTLVLIGISGTTALSSVVIGDSKGQDLVKATAALMDERTLLALEIPALTAVVAAAGPAAATAAATLVTKQARLTVITDTITNNLRGLAAGGSKGFFTDILSDDNGISFHRLQMLVWTLVLGVLFVYGVWARLSMPEFSTTLLALQGITAGTYIGFKIPEKQA
jgi:hypothetical protein